MERKGILRSILPLALGFFLMPCIGQAQSNDNDKEDEGKKEEAKENFQKTIVHEVEVKDAPLKEKVVEKDLKLSGEKGIGSEKTEEEDGKAKKEKAPEKDEGFVDRRPKADRKKGSEKEEEKKGQDDE